VTRRGLGRRVRLAGFLLRFGAGDVFRLREREQITQLGGVGEVS
jgi:hypothetical protein